MKLVKSEADMFFVLLKKFSTLVRSLSDTAAGSFESFTSVSGSYFNLLSPMFANPSLSAFTVGDFVLSFLALNGSASGSPGGVFGSGPV